MLLDAWLGGETVDSFSEVEVRETIKRFIVSPEIGIDRVEGIGALNFLTLDDLSVREEGEVLDPESIIELPEQEGRPVFPPFEASRSDPFLQRIQASTKKWVVVTSPGGEPRAVVDADALVRTVMMGDGPVQIERFCHHPEVVEDAETMLGDVLPRLRVQRESAGDDVIGRDVILVWGRERRIITGADILGRLLRGIARPEAASR